jgi:hypothetical protein
VNDGASARPDCGAAAADHCPDIKDDAIRGDRGAESGGGTGIHRSCQQSRHDLTNADNCGTEHVIEKFRRGTPSRAEGGREQPHGDSLSWYRRSSLTVERRKHPLYCLEVKYAVSFGERAYTKV